MLRCIEGLKTLGMKIFAGTYQLGTVSFVPDVDCESFANALAKSGICVRAGLHCAPLAHESAETLESGTVRVSFCHSNTIRQVDYFLRAVGNIVN